MKILCVSDQFAGSKESLIEGIFQGPMRGFATVTVVYFSKELHEPGWQGADLIIPYKYKHQGSAYVIGKFIDLLSIDVVFVRNFFSVLSSFLKTRNSCPFQIGFWNTFPHTFRRYFQAQLENKLLFRKRIEYYWRSFHERRLVQQCDFLVVMSPEFKTRFFPTVTIPWMSLPMGFASADLPEGSLLTEDHYPRRFIYIGTVDPLRQTGMIAEALACLKEDFILDIYTQSNNSSVDQIRRLGDRRIRVLSPLPRRKLYAKMVEYDVGIGLVPENELFNVSSPTKAIEYYAVGLPVLINHLPEYRTLFDERSAVICDFSAEDIKSAVRKIIAMPKEKLVSLGKEGQFTVRKRREYSILSHDLAVFLTGVCGDNLYSDREEKP